MPISTALRDVLLDRIIPSIARAFHYRATRFEGFKIVSYDAGEGGYFRRHRDNISAQTRHRRFALSVNLNDDYEGGCLTFPEFGPFRYRPPAGGGIVFSGTHLHEVTEVTAGRRSVLPTFLWGEDAVPNQERTNN
ncbi:MAG: 2OG-Fe(II) oxygenase [Ectothiorhodospiraceae bacterium]|nr:2OG-Fe(II) oxygenase [Ectothiorhodospiraceae bacterium]